MNQLHALNTLPKVLSKLLLLVFCCMISSCAMHKETYENPDRRCWQKEPLSFGGKISCEAFIDFLCPDEQLFSEKRLAGRQGRIYLKLVEGPSSPEVGDLYAHVQPFPIFVKNGSPWETLQKDISRILSQQGYTLVNDLNDAQYIVETDLILLDVRSDPGGFTDLKGTTLAKVKFNVAFFDANDKPVWSNEFVGERQIKASYFYLKDSATTLVHAYCQALDDFSKATWPEVFKGIVD